MLVVVHNNTSVVRVIEKSSNSEISFGSEAIIKELYKLAESRQDAVLIWCHEDLFDYIDYNYIHEAFYLKNLMMSFSHQDFLKHQIGYVEDSPFLKVNKQVKYPTWLMSSMVGAIYTSELIKYRDLVNDNNFDLALNSISKLGMPNGLFCYSDPKLVSKVNWPKITIKQSTTFELFKFVKKHYKWLWIFLLFFNFLVYEKRFFGLAFLKSWFYKSRQINFTHELALLIENLTEVTNLPSIDVIIPTIGRRECLYDVLKDLSFQTHLPKRVIIIEQNPDLNSNTDLDYLSNETWPFEIFHEFTHQIGACNARNLALSKVKSDFVFFGDDDIRFDDKFIENGLSFVSKYKIDNLTCSCLRNGEIEKNIVSYQWLSFGSGCSFCNSNSIKNIEFDMAFEFGYGEDTDYGSQLRQAGFDIVYNPHLKIKHLKAPIGGFRSRFKQIWDNDIIKPKPSPTVMLSYLKNKTIYQQRGYKTILFSKFFLKQSIRNPIIYYRSMQKRWRLSVQYASKLKL